MTDQTVGIVGLGFLGRGIAACLLGYGFRVIAYTRQDQTFAAARKHIQTAIDELIERAHFPESLRTDWTQRYTEVHVLSAMHRCDFVIESVLEDLELKRKIFETLETVVRPDVPIASNTSGLPITLLQSGRQHPDRFIGMHWGEPCHVMRFLEVIAGDNTSPQTIQRTVALGKAAGKDPAVVKRDIEGFIANRLGYAMYREAFYLLESGVADVETIDRSFRNAFGLWASIAGPFRWMDLTGVPAYALVMRRLLPKLCVSQEVPESLRRLVDSGATGVEGRAGFYTYTEAQAQRWQKLLHEHAWAVRELTEKLGDLE